MTIPGYTPNSTLTGITSIAGKDASFAATLQSIVDALKGFPRVIYSTADNWDLLAMYRKGIPAALQNVMVSGVPVSATEVPMVAYVDGKLTAMFGAVKANYINSLSDDNVGYLNLPPVLMPPLCKNMIIADVGAVQPSLYAAQIGYKNGVIFSAQAVAQSGLSGDAINALQRGIIPDESIRFKVRSASGMMSPTPTGPDSIDPAAVIYMFVATFDTLYGETIPSTVLTLGPIDSFDNIVLDVETPVPSYVKAVRYYMAYTHTGQVGTELLSADLRKGFLFPASSTQSIGQLVGKYLQWNGSSLDPDSSTVLPFELLQEVLIK